MKAKFTLCLGLFFCFLAGAWAQPANDDCSNPQFINLNAPAPCPSTTPANTVINGTTINATPISPYPQLQCTNGDQNSAPAAEVWYAFDGVSNIIDIIISGMTTPNIVLFSGEDCSFLTPLNCDRGSAGALSFTTNILVGQRYFLMVSGGSVADQANFTLTIRSRNNCNPCLLDQTLTVSPPPINGTYSSGQDVTVCMTINQWDVTATIEWLHAVTVEFGPGWDLNTLDPSPPGSCDGDGQWDWYESWTPTNAANAGTIFGPGFAYDSSNGGPFDGNPGNNWGDPCQDFGGFPLTFCWTVSVADCQDTGGPNVTGSDLSMVVNIWSDGDSGSWNQTGCNSGFTFNFLASVVCCSGIEPIATPTPTTCPGANNGRIQIDPLGGGPYQYYVFFNNGSSPLITVPPTSNIVNLNNLAVGSYSIVALDIASGCNLSVNPQPVEIVDGPVPTAIPDVNTPCPGDPFILTGSTDLSGSSIQYQWTGPGGFSQSGQTVQAAQAGVYTLRVTVDGCQSQPQTVTAQFLTFAIDAQAADASVCLGQDVVLTALGTDLVNVEWEIVNTGQNLGNDNPLVYTVTQTDLSNSPITFLATGTDVNGCEATDQVVVTVNPLPEITFNISGNRCVGSSISVTALGASTYFWEDGLTNNPRFFVINQSGPFSMQIFGQDANGCQAEGELELFIDPSPTVTISAPATTICRGSSVTLTGNGAQTYNWSTGQTNQPSITVSPNATQTYSVLGTNAAGCTDDAEITITVVNPIAAPVISCGTVTPSSVQFTWPAVAGATGYNVTVNTGQTGTLSGTTYTVNNLNPGTPVTITVVAVSPNAACPNTMDTETCSSQSCPPVNVAINPVADVCFTPGLPPIDLQATITGGASGTSTWTGTGIINAATGIFDITAAGIGSHQIILTYAEGLCTFKDTLQIRVFQTPTSTFNLGDTEICNNQAATATYTGNAGAGATYTWNFNGGNAVPGIGPGPHQISWSSPGVKTVSLQVTENGCTSTVSSDLITVTAPLTPPNITCGTSTTTSTVFNWAPVAGATGYTVNVLSGPAGTLNGTSYSVTGLNPGQSVQIQVIAETNDPCGPVSSNFTCSAASCPDFIFSITPVAAICLTAGAPSVNLVASVSGGAGNGTLTWSGPGVTGSTFNPTTAGPGSHTLTATYTEGPCSESESIVVQVSATPVASFSASPSSGCTNQPVTLTFNGSVTNAANATFTWNFNGGTAAPGTGPGPHQVSWASPGAKTVSLQVTENGCVSGVSNQMINITAGLTPPAITCGLSTTTSVEFNWAPVAGATGYTVNVLSGPAGTLNGTTYSVTGLNPGQPVEIQVIAETNDPCGPVSSNFTCSAAPCPDFVFNITPVAPICLVTGAPPVPLVASVSGGAGNGTLTWSGPGVTGTNFNPATAGAGSHTLTATYTEGPCSESEDIVVQVFATPVASFTVSQSPVCINQATTLTFDGSVTNAANATFTWNFNGGTANPASGAGPIAVSWPTSGQKTVTLTITENGCSSSVFSQTVEVQNPMATPVINCIPSPDAITFSWADVAGATGYQVNVLSGQTGTQNGNSFTVGGLVPGNMVQLEVIALGNGPCGNSVDTLTCTAEVCPDITLAVTPVSEICLDASADPIDLAGTVTGGDGTGVETWSGPGVINTSQGIFDPAVAGPGNHSITFSYQQGNCPYSTSIIIIVNEQPTADFTAEQPVCTDDQSTITFTGNAGPGAAFTWDFDGATVSSGSGAGPYEVSWATGGVKNISLIVAENNCPSEPFSSTVAVQSPIGAPVINCTSTTTSVLFAWADVPGASGYTVDVLNGPAGTQNGNSFLIEGLMPEESVTIRVTANTSNVCGPVSTDLTCSAAPCPPVILAPVDQGPLCTDSGVQNLTVNITGQQGGGNLTWSGPGITSPSGAFDPAAAGPGSFTVTVTYEEGVCTYSATLDLNVSAVPVASFTAAGPICAGATTQVVFNGMAGPLAQYDWSFAGGVVEGGSGAGPYTISWADPGTKTISLTITDNGCVSGLYTAEVEVIEPLAAPEVECQTTSTSSITFGWQPVAGASDYQVTVLNGPQGVLAGTTYTINNLTPNQEITIQVIAVGTGPCGNSEPGEASCIANNCLPLNLTLSPSQTLCAGSSTQLAFDFNTSSAGPFVVTYAINGTQQAPVTLADNGIIPFSNVTQNITLQVISIQDGADANCVYPGNDTWTLTVSQPVDAGTAQAAARFCQGEGAPVNLADLITGEQNGGIWTEVSAIPSTGGAFNAASGAFNPASQSAGTYQFRYFLDAAAPCADDETTVQVVVEATPKAVAGEDQLLTCSVGVVSLGGNSSSGTGITYAWTVNNPDIVIPDADNSLIDVNQPGVYTLTVTNELGCSSTDQVEVTSENASPVAEIGISEISCFQANDGAITIEDVNGGSPPYQYSFNGGPFNSQTQFAFLGPETYTLVVRDQNGCLSELSINLTQPEELTVTLVTDLEAGQNTIEEGESITLRAVFNPNVTLDTIIWQPDSLALSGNPTSISVMPTATTEFSVTIIDTNGCMDADDETIFVRKVRPVFIPNAFSPDDDGFNDLFYVHSRDNSVSRIKSFLVFNRWGETMMELYDFQPNDPAYGWDGRHRGRPMNPGVYVYYVEVEFRDGEIILYEGDVSLLK